MKHSVQYKEYLENPSNEIAVSNSNQEKEKSPQDSNIRQLIREEYCIEEVKNVIEQPTKCGTRIAKSLQNFRVKKSSISLNNTSHISPVHAITPVFPTEEEPKYSLSMGYEHLSIIPEIEFDEVTESGAKNLLPILIFTTFSNPLFDDNDDFTSSDAESLSNEDVPMEDFKSNTIIETLPISPIQLEDSDSQREEIDIFTSTDGLLPPSIESDDYDSEGDINVLEVLLVDDSIFLPENESFYFDHHDNLSFPRPPSEPPDVEFFLDSKPELISPVMNNNDELNEDECFDPEGEIDVFTNVKDDDTFPSCLSFEFSYHISSILRFLLYFSLLRVKTSFLTLASSFRAGGISLGRKFHVLLCLS
nr:hypothetical protein [Tanacetum cinerariifolium]